MYIRVCSKGKENYVSKYTFQLTFRLSCNYFPLYHVLNKCIKDMMIESGTRSIFGAISTPCGNDNKAETWKSNAWEGFNPANHASIASYNKLTLPY